MNKIIAVILGVILLASLIIFPIYAESARKLKNINARRIKIIKGWLLSSFSVSLTIGLIYSTLKQTLPSSVMPPGIVIVFIGLNFIIIYRLISRIKIDE